VISDITEHKRVEQALRESEERFVEYSKRDLPVLPLWEGTTAS
jgi:hypothetical protein